MERREREEKGLDNRWEDGWETCRVGLYQRGDGGGMINRKQNLPDYLEEGTEEGPIYQQNC